MEFWNSIEQLSKINDYLRILLVVFGILSGITGAMSFVVSHRKDSLAASENIQFKQKVDSLSSRTQDISELKYRTLTPEQTEAIRARLTGIGKILVFTVVHNSKESKQYSRQFEAIFESVGWNVHHFDPGERRREVSPPVILKNDAVSKSKAFDALSEVLQEQGLPFSFSEAEGNMEHEIIIDVGVIPANDYQSVIDKVH